MLECTQQSIWLGEKWLLLCAVDVDRMPPHAQDLHGLVWWVHWMSPEHGSATSKAIVFAKPLGILRHYFLMWTLLFVRSPVKLWLLSEPLLQGRNHPLDLCGEGKKNLVFFSSTLLNSPVGALYLRLIKDTWAREKYATLHVLCDMGSFIRKWRPEEMVNLNAYTRFGEEWKGVGKCDRTKGCEVRAVNWGELGEAFILVFLSMLWA